MFENGLDRVITYKFQLPEDGEYTVEVGFASPWGNSVPAALYLNGNLAADGIMATAEECGVATGTASPVDGVLTVEGKSDMPTLNMAYIIISKVPAPAEEPAAEVTEPEAEEPAETAPEAAPETEAAAPAEPQAPKTGLALAALPAALAAAAMAVTKRR